MSGRRSERPRDLEGLVALLASGDSGARYWAVKDLAQFGAAAVDALVEALEPDDVTVRCAAAEALAEIGEARAAGPLTALYVRATNSAVRESVRRALRRLGAADITALIEALSSDDAIVRQEAASLLGDLQATEAVEPLLANLDTSPAFARPLSSIGDPRAVPSLIALLEAGEPLFMRVAAAEALGQIRDTKASPSLLAALSHPDAKTRSSAAMALGRTGDETTIKPLLTILLNRPGFHGDFLPWKWRKDHGNQAPLIEAVSA